MDAKPGSTILGISPGSRLIGVAVLRGGELIDWRIKTFKGKWGKQKLNIILLSLQRTVKDCGVTVISIKALHPALSSPGIKQIASGLEKQAQAARIKLHCYTIREIKEYCSTMENNNKRTLAKFLADKNPELLCEYNKEKMNRN